MTDPLAYYILGFKPALISKGLRLLTVKYTTFSVGFKPALISKGLRQNSAPFRTPYSASSQP